MTVKNYSKFEKFSAFAFASGLGLLISFIIYFVLVSFFELQPMVANIVSDFFALLLVFLVSWTSIFYHNHHFILIKFFFFSGYRISSIFFFSYLIGLLSLELHLLFMYSEYEIPFSIAALLSKFIITPITFLTNYIVAFYIFEKLLRKQSYESS